MYAATEYGRHLAPQKQCIAFLCPGPCPTLPFPQLQIPSFAHDTANELSESIKVDDF